MLERLRTLLDRSRNALTPTAEPDVEADTATARTRETGGGQRDDRDSASTTGTGRSGEFVGRVAGQDEGDAEESGAEVRARRGQEPG